METSQVCHIGRRYKARTSSCRCGRKLAARITGAAVVLGGVLWLVGIAPAANSKPVAVDGERIAFSRGTYDGYDANLVVAHIVVMNVDGSGLVALTSNQRGQQLAPAWAPDGSKLVYVEAVNNTKGSTLLSLDLFTADGSVRALTGTIEVESGPVAAPAGASLVAPSFSPDGDRLVYARIPSGGGFSHLWTISLHGGRPRQLTSGSFSDWSPAWSPNGRYVAFFRGHLATKNYRPVSLEILNLKTRRVRHLASVVQPVGEPSWSPDSRQIAYSLPFGPTTGGVMLVSTNGAAARRAGGGWEPSWSADGRQIAYAGAETVVTDVTGKQGVNNALGLENVDGTGQRLLTNPKWPLWDEYPAFAPPIASGWPPLNFVR